MHLLLSLLALLLFIVSYIQAVPPVLNYAGQVGVNGQPFEGEGLFKFALVNTDGKFSYWSNDGASLNGSELQAEGTQRTDQVLRVVQEILVVRKLVLKMLM